MLADDELCDQNDENNTNMNLESRSEICQYCKNPIDQDKWAWHEYFNAS